MIVMWYLTTLLYVQMEAKRGGLNMLGFSDSCLPFMIESFPRLLLLSVEQQLKPLFLFLQFAGVPKENIKDILLLFPPIIFYNIDKDIKPRISALQKVRSYQILYSMNDLSRVRSGNGGDLKMIGPS